MADGENRSRELSVIVEDAGAGLSDGSSLQTSDIWHGSVVFVVLLTVYMMTMPLRVGLADSGLFLMASHFFGVAHPSGYPLHTILGHLAASIPVSGVPFRVHLVSAVFGAGTCSLVWLFSRRLSVSIVAAYAAALGFGVSAAFWSQAIIAEVYTLNTFLFFLILNLVVVYRDTGNRRLISWSAFLFGLSLSNHWPLMILAAPCFLIVAWPRALELVRNSPRLAGLFVLGLLPYFSMVLRSQADPILNFLGPIRTFEKFWYFVSRKGYLPIGENPAVGFFDGVQFSAFVANEMISQFTVVGFAVVVVGVWQLKRNLDLSLFCALSWAAVSNSFLLLLILKMDFDYMTQSSFMVIPLVAYGILGLALGAGFDWVLGSFKGWPRQHLIGIALCSLLVGSMFFVHLGENSRRSYDFADDVARTILRTLEKDAVIVTTGDVDTLPLGYLHHVEGVREDVTIYNFDGLVFNNRIFSVPFTAGTRARKWQEFLDTNTRPVYASVGLFEEKTWWDYGLYRRLVDEGTADQQVMPPVPDEVLELLDRITDFEPVDPQTIRARNRILISLAMALNRFGMMTEDPKELNRLLPYIERLDTLFPGKLGKVIAGYGFQEPEDLMVLMDERQMLSDHTMDNWTKARFYYLRGLLNIAMENDEFAMSDWRRSAIFDRNPGTNRAMGNILRHHFTNGDRQGFDDAKALYFPRGLPQGLQKEVGDWLSN